MSCSVKYWEKDRKPGNVSVRYERAGFGDTLHGVREERAL